MASKLYQVDDFTYLIEAASGQYLINATAVEYVAEQVDTTKLTQVAWDVLIYNILESAKAKATLLLLESEIELLMDLAIEKIEDGD